ncbi:hypothetical protein DPMN_012449 [Dreissena polymorpha]|uniref:Uncharacterized protein n=1 Tax=Dreissena polymorpha TaxID=45954 RepID=A0A9D4N6Z9_DREPO|nr:hypothetical protein DPMN_012449 [Dreissena polymorpha]
MIRDRIVFGTNSSKIREKLINEGETLTLDKTLQIAQSYEYSKDQLKSMQSTASNDVAIISKPGRRKQHIKGGSGGNKGATGRAQTKDDGMARRPLQKNNRSIPHNCNKSCNNC